MPRLDKLDKAIKHLSDREGGWVYRRDAADLLGRTAAQAIAALREFENEPDVDVKAAVNNALLQVREALQGVGADGRLGYSLEALANYMAKAGEREVSPHGEGYVVDVTLKGGRCQRVYMEPFVQRSGRAMMRLYSVCGPAPSEKVRAWALHNNTQFSLCAAATMEHEGEERLVLVNNFVLEWAEPQTVKASLKEICHYADWLEKKLTGEDVY